jgi:hypothetical protein
MKVDYIEIRENVLPKNIGSKYTRKAFKHFGILLASAALVFFVVYSFLRERNETAGTIVILIVAALEFIYLHYINVNYCEHSYRLHWNYDRFSKTLAQYGIDDPDAFAKNIEILEDYFRFRGSESERREEINRLLGIFYGETEAKEDDEKLLGMLSRGDADGK